MAKYTRSDETVAGGLYIRGGHIGEDDKHYGGEVVNADGEVLATFTDKQVNDGKAPKDKNHDDKSSK